MYVALFKVIGCATIRSKESSLKVDDLKEASEIVYAAVLELTTLCNDIEMGQVTGKEIENYRRQIDRLQLLYEAANVGSTQLAPQFVRINDGIKNCVKRLAKVIEYRSKLLVVVYYCKQISTSE